MTYGDGDSSTFTGLLGHRPNTTSFRGTAAVFNTEMLDLNIVGTIRPQTFDTEMLSVGNHGEVYLCIGELRPGTAGHPRMLTGACLIWDSTPAVFMGLVHGRDTTIDRANLHARAGSLILDSAISTMGAPCSTRSPWAT